MYDGLTETVVKVSSDYEKSPHLVMRYKSAQIPWVTLNTSAPDAAGKITSTLTISPNLKQSGVYTLTLEAFDGAYVSQEWVITITVTYDPPVAGKTLVNQKVIVGETIFYSTPAKNGLR